MVRINRVTLASRNTALSVCYAKDGFFKFFSVHNSFTTKTMPKSFEEYFYFQKYHS
jgi:hypothetical protein